MRFHLNWFLILALAACPAAWGQEKGEAQPGQAAAAAETQDDEKELTTQEKLKALQGDQRKMMMELGREFRAATDPAQKAEVMQQRRDIEAELATKAMALVKQSDDDEASVQILSWVASSLPGDAADQATEVLMTKYIESPAIGSLAGRLARQQPSPKTEQMLRTIMEKNPSPEVQGQAMFSLVNYLGSLKRYAELDDQVKQQFAKSMGEDGPAYMAKWTPKAIDDASLKLLETCVAKYGDVKMGRRTIGAMAESKLFVLKYLQIGMVAPDIEGADLDEVAFKLSDYRGKVVVLDFWGDW